MRKIYLEVNFKDKDKVKNLGAKWDGELKRWFITEEDSLNSFREFFPKDFDLKKEIRETETKSTSEICRELNMSRRDFLDYLQNNGFIDKDSFVTKKGEKVGIVQTITSTGKHKLLYKNKVKDLFDKEKSSSFWNLAIYEERKRIILLKLEKEIPLNEIAMSLELAPSSIENLLEDYVKKDFIKKESISYLIKKDLEDKVLDSYKTYNKLKDLKSRLKDVSYIDIRLILLKNGLKYN